VLACGLFRYLNSDLLEETAPRPPGQKGSIRLVARVLRFTKSRRARLPLQHELTLAPLWSGFSLALTEEGTTPQ